MNTSITPETRARLTELRRILAEDPNLDSVSDAEKFSQELAELERREKAAIRAAMRREVENCRDRITGEVNYTLLAETVANELDIYDDTEDYTIPEYVFELATEFGS